MSTTFSICGVPLLTTGLPEEVNVTNAQIVPASDVPPNVTVWTDAFTSPGTYNMTTTFYYGSTQTMEHQVFQWNADGSQSVVQSGVSMALMEQGYQHRYTPDNVHVAEVAAWLDVRQPGWASRIDVERLNLSSEVDCIAGQLGLDWRQLRTDFGDDHGYIPTGMLVRGLEFWKQEIAKRVAEPVPA